MALKNQEITDYYIRVKTTQIPLLPFTWLYQGITQFRNYLYDHSYIKSFDFETRVINVGNLTVGGTGKTPHVEYLIRQLRSEASICTLSRGYGRKSSGFILADKTATADLIGDEPMQFFRKFSPKVGVAVGEDRVEAIPNILFERQETNLIILDDAFQHRAVVPLLNILLCDFNRPFYEDYPFPAGRLREGRCGARRADIVIVSKCPATLSVSEQEGIQQKIQKYTRSGTAVFFTTMHYAPVHHSKNRTAKEEAKLRQGDAVLLVSGIAQAQALEAYVGTHFNLVEHLEFPDHHHYQEKDLEKIKKIAKKHRDIAVLTTEKDEVKLAAAAFGDFWKDISRHYLPIEVRFLGREEEFLDLLKKAL